MNAAIHRWLTLILVRLAQRPPVIMYDGDRCCRWCRGLVLDDFEHDFCEPTEHVDADCDELASLLAQGST